MPWYVAGPLIGAMVPALLLLGNKPFGVSANFRHLCAAATRGRADYFRYDWKQAGAWNLVFLLGMAAGGFLSVQFFPVGSLDLAPQTVAALSELGVSDFRGLAPSDVFSWKALFSFRGFIATVIAGFLVGFGTAYAGGCTSGHAIAGLSDLQLPSLVAVCGFFAGGLFATFVLMPLAFR
jgi:uncharacterized protein